MDKIAWCPLVCAQLNSLNMIDSRLVGHTANDKTPYFVKAVECSTVYICHTVLQGQMTHRLVPYLDYCEEHCNQQSGTCTLEPSGFIKHVDPLHLRGPLP